MKKRRKKQDAAQGGQEEVQEVQAAPGSKETEQTRRTAEVQREEAEVRREDAERARGEAEAGRTRSESHRETEEAIRTFAASLRADFEVLEKAANATRVDLAEQRAANQEMVNSARDLYERASVALAAAEELYAAARAVRAEREKLDDAFLMSEGAMEEGRDSGPRGTFR